MARSSGGISGSGLWLKADMGPSSSVEGANIFTWSDQSGNTRNLIQNTVGRQPQYQENWQNFNPAVNFNSGSSTTKDFMSYSGSSAHGASGDYSIYTVLDLDGGSNHQIQGSASGNPKHALFGPSINEVRYVHQFNTTNYFPS